MLLAVAENVASVLHGTPRLPLLKGVQCPQCVAKASLLCCWLIDNHRAGLHWVAVVMEVILGVYGSITSLQVDGVPVCQGVMGGASREHKASSV